MSDAQEIMDKQKNEEEKSWFSLGYWTSALGYSTQKLNGTRLIVKPQTPDQILINMAIFDSEVKESRKKDKSEAYWKTSWFNPRLWSSGLSSRLSSGLSSALDSAIDSVLGPFAIPEFQESNSNKGAQTASEAEPEKSWFNPRSWSSGLGSFALLKSDSTQDTRTKDEPQDDSSLSGAWKKTRSIVTQLALLILHMVLMFSVFTFATFSPFGGKAMIYVIQSVSFGISAYVWIFFESQVTENFYLAGMLVCSHINLCLG
jgi:hypothetical protein